MLITILYVFAPCMSHTAESSVTLATIYQIPAPILFYSEGY